MDTQFGKNGNSCRDKAAANGFTFDCTYAQRGLEGAFQSATAAIDEGCSLVPEISLLQENRGCKYSGHHYERLVSALGGAEPEYVPADRDRPVNEAACEVPSALERQCMAVLSITYEAGVYGYQGFHCDRLADAVTYAYLRRHSDAIGPSW